jgi:hypothetical protein
LLCSIIPDTKRIVGTGKQFLREYNWGFAYVDGIVALADGLDVFRLRVIALWEGLPPDNLSFAKRTLVG